MAKDDNHLSEQYITFTIGEEDYAISIINVEEIVKVTNLIKVPKSQSYFVGLMDIRGKVVNMIDLSKKIMNKKVGDSPMNRAIIVKIDGKSLGSKECPLVISLEWLRKKTASSSSWILKKFFHPKNSQKSRNKSLIFYPCSSVSIGGNL